MSDRLLVREQVTVADALEMLDMAPPDRAGKIACPFHEENTPSCQVYDDHFHCFGCGANGDVVWFVAQLTGAPLWKAEQYLLGACEDAPRPSRAVSEAPVREVQNLTHQYEEVAGTDHGGMLREIAEKYCRQRWDLNLDQVAPYAAVGNDGLWIPYWHSHVVVGIKIRKWNGQKTSVPGSTFNLSPYLGWNEVLRSVAGGVVLCEGEPDTWVMRRYHKAVGLPSGASAYPDSVHDYLRKHTRVYLALDDDDAGRKAAENITRRLLKDSVRVTNLAYQFKRIGSDVCDAVRAGWRPQFT